MRKIKTVLIMGLIALTASVSFAHHHRGPFGPGPFGPYPHHHGGHHRGGGDWWIPAAIIGGSIVAGSIINASSAPTTVVAPSTTTVVVPSQPAQGRVIRIDVMPDGSKVYYYGN